ncbi:bacteriocin immunity protein [Lactobacillus helveticus]|uniref:bacteriocin immunity protein n=1 Tax=Lactobacillus helveticus TaxID=1587 RepID=UPI0031D1719F
MYNELNINKYKTIRDAAGLVMRKSEKGDHPLAYTSKLVMYIQSQIALKHLSLTNQQQKILKELQKRSQYVNLNYVYTSLRNCQIFCVNRSFS